MIYIEIQRFMSFKETPPRSQNKSLHGVNITLKSCNVHAISRLRSNLKKKYLCCSLVKIVFTSHTASQ